jgi:uncharacterized protein YdeI (YjbR/CyaY-like superfamily)
MMDKIDNYIQKHPKWANALNRLRELLQQTEMEETIKWGAPVYTVEGKNVVGMAAFKNHFGLWFFNGVFLKDEKELLVNANEEKTKALRQMRFNSEKEMDDKLILQYVNEAIANQKAGKELKPERKKGVELPMELTATFQQEKEFESAFKELTPGKQREYAEYIASAKQEKTKLSRLNKIIPMVKEGKGLYDKYKNC